MKFCLIGEKLSHSFSKEIHQKTGLDYSLCPVKRGCLTDFVNGCAYNGFNVTIPYKKEIIPLLDGIDQTAKDVGAVNTVKVENGKLYGYNTDILGMKFLIERKGVSLKDKCVMVLGTGGTSNMAVTLAKNCGAKEVTVVGRTSPINYVNCYKKVETQIIINTTPVGMNPDLTSKPIELSKFKNLIAVFDAVYNPQRTALIEEAQNLGLICSNGLPMLVEQALCAQDIWLNKTHTHLDSEQILAHLIGKKLNIVLTGMPGCGKSTVGKILSQKLGREFFDTDEEIFNSCGKTPAEIIKGQGEDAFRNIESEVLQKLCCYSGAIISCGGGSVIREINRKNIRANGLTFYIKRDLNLLSLEGRPLSKDNGVEKLYRERKELYEQADITVENNGEIENTVEEIIKNYENSCIEWSKP